MRLGRKRPKIIQDLLHHFFTFFFTIRWCFQVLVIKNIKNNCIFEVELINYYFSFLSYGTILSFLKCQWFCLIDFYRYLNHRLDTPLVSYRFDEDLPENYRFIWARKILPNHFVSVFINLFIVSFRFSEN